MCSDALSPVKGAKGASSSLQDLDTISLSWELREQANRMMAALLPASLVETTQIIGHIFPAEAAASLMPHGAGRVQKKFLEFSCSGGQGLSSSGEKRDLSIYDRRFDLNRPKSGLLNHRQCPGRQSCDS